MRVEFVYQGHGTLIGLFMHTQISLDVARALTPGDGWWDRPQRRSIFKLAAVGMERLTQIVLGR